MSRSHVEKCDCCGRFIKFGAGVSWAQTWSYDLNGCPDLHDPKFRCAPCTEKNGPRETNCAYPERYSGVLRQEIHA